MVTPQGSPLFSKEFLLEVLKGNVPGHKLVHVHGHNPDVGISGPEDIWVDPTFLVYLASAETMNIVSTDGNDTAAGTGARTVLIKGQLAGNVTDTEIVTLNGTTPVTTTKSWLRVLQMDILTVGCFF